MPFRAGCAFGYERDGMTIRESEAVLLRQAVDVLRGRSLTSICNEWNAAGVLTAGDNMWRTHRSNCCCYRRAASGEGNDGKPYVR